MKSVIKKPVRPARRAPQKPTVASLLAARIAREQKLCAKFPVAALNEKLSPITVAAVRLGISVWTLRHYASEGRLNYRRIGRRLFVTETEIARLAGNELQAVNAA